MRNAKTRKIKKIQKILIYVIAFLIAVIFLGTAIGLLKRKANSDGNTRTESPSEIRGNKKLFTDLGRLRASTGDEEPCIVVVSPVFEYNSKDKAFEEELVQKKEEIRSLILAWFSQYKAHELYSMSEVEVKKALLNATNSILDLSKIEKLYFKEFVILQ